MKVAQDYEQIKKNSRGKMQNARSVELIYFLKII